MNENTKEQETESRPEDAQASEQVKAVRRSHDEVELLHDELKTLILQKNYKEYQPGMFSKKYEDYTLWISFFEESDYYDGALQIIIEQRFLDDDYDTPVFNGAVKTLNEFKIICKLCDKFAGHDFA